MFKLIGNEIGFHELYKHVALTQKNMFWPVSRKVVLFPALLQGKKVSFQFALSHPAFHLIYSKERFYLILAKFRCFRILSLRRTFSFVFVTKLHFWCSILPKKCCGSLATKLGCFEPHVTKKQCFPILCLKYLPLALLQEERVLISLP